MSDHYSHRIVTIDHIQIILDVIERGNLYRLYYSAHQSPTHSYRREPNQVSSFTWVHDAIIDISLFSETC